MFHEKYPEVNMAINVTRHPFSFRGERPLDKIMMDDQNQEIISTDELSIQARRQKILGRADASSERSPLQRLGDSAGINFNIDRTPYYNPLDSQRALQWSGRFDLQEQFMEVLSHNHFELAMSASRRHNVLQAVSEVKGLVVTDALSFLQSDELVDEVTKAYAENVHVNKITSIPFFVFNLPQCGINGGPFQIPPLNPVRGPWMKTGSNSPVAFLLSFEAMYKVYKQQQS
jgi:predicted DsbA family dithiol-disulfide isomerase